MSLKDEKEINELCQEDRHVEKKKNMDNTKYKYQYRYGVGVEYLVFRIQIYVVRDFQEAGDSVVCMCKTYDQACKITRLMNEEEEKICQNDMK